jgi:hypothetical protein
LLILTISSRSRPTRLIGRYLASATCFDVPNHSQFQTFQG